MVYCPLNGFAWKTTIGQSILALMVSEDSLIVGFVANAVRHTVTTPNNMLLHHKLHEDQRECIRPQLVPAINRNDERQEEGHEKFQEIVMSVQRQNGSKYGF
jgi:hypothetical protein